MESTRIEARDAAMRLLNRMTFWTGAAAFVAVGAFAAVSAATIPGSASTSNQTSSTANSTSSTSSQASTSNDSSSTSSASLQPSSGEVSAAPSGSGMVATGSSR